MTKIAMPKGKDELRFEAYQPKGKDAIASIRQFYKDKDGEYKPGKQGLTLTYEEIPVFVKRLKQLYDDLSDTQDT